MGNIRREIENERMHRREITLADGRYMIFYTFGEGTAGENDAPGKMQDDRAEHSPLSTPPKPEME